MPRFAFAVNRLSKLFFDGVANLSLKDRATRGPSGRPRRGGAF